MDIVIIANFCGKLDGESNSRFLELATILSQKEQVQVEVITTDYIHGIKQHITKPLVKYPFRITLLHESGYPKNVCLKRFFSHHMFGKNVAAYLSKRKKPDVIYAAVPSLTASFEAARYCARTRTRFVIDVQDLWPEAFQMVFNVPVISFVVFAPFRYMANKVYAAADGICAVSRTYLIRALSVNHKCEQGTVAFLGTNLQAFDEKKELAPTLNKPDGEVWMAYIGTLGHSYDLTCIMDAMVLLRNQGHANNLRFIVMGDGPLRSKFETYAQESDLPVTFTGMLPYSKMIPTLCACDFAVNPIMHGAAQSIINKVGDYAAAGLAVVNTQECLEYRELLAKYRAGINCENQNIKSISNAIRRLAEDEELRVKMGKGNRNLAEDYFDRSKSYARLLDEILCD